MKNDIKDCAYGSCNGYKVSYKIQVRENFARTAFEKEYPMIDISPFFSANVSRVMRINKVKQEI